MLIFQEPTTSVRKRLGVDIVDGQVTTSYPKSEVLKGLTKLVDEIGTGTVKVGNLMTVADRTRYINGFNSDQLPDPNARLEGAESLSEAPEKPRQAPKPKDRRRSNARTKLIPAECSISIPPGRINDIYLELKRKLRVDEVPNAAGVLLRVFLDLSVQDYMDRNSTLLPKDTFAANVLAVADHLKANDAMTDKDLVPVREAVKSTDKLNLATNLNALVHNRQMTVSGNDLKAIWDRLELFSKRIWA